MRKTSNGAVKPITPLGQARQVEQAQVKPSKQFKNGAVWNNCLVTKALPMMTTTI